jgi:hypothetical protein
VRAERGVLQNQLRSGTEAAGRGSMAPQIDTLLRNMEGRETTVRYKQLRETSNLLLSAAPERFKAVGAMDTMLGQLADVSRDPQAFSMVSQAFTRILAEGKIDRQHLNEMSVDTGFAFKKAMADALKVTPEQLLGSNWKNFISPIAEKVFPLLNPGGVDACVADQVVWFAGPS